MNDLYNYLSDEFANSNLFHETALDPFSEATYKCHQHDVDLAK